MTQSEYRTGTALLDPEARPQDAYRTPSAAAPPEAEPVAPAGEDPLEGLFAPPQTEKPDLSQARSFLTELHPSGFGELLVTDVWLPPTPEAGVEPMDRRQAWRRRQERRELNLLRERAAASYDARTEHYWRQVQEGMKLCPQAIVDPYTTFAASLADADFARLSEYRREAQQYGYTADSLLRYGRACLALGRLKSARRALRQAVKLEPYLSEAWWNLGLAHLFARAHAPAAEALSHAFDQNPGDYRTESALGVARFHGRDFPGAEECFRRTAGPSGLRAACRSMLACSLRAQGKWEEARIELGFLKYGGSSRWAEVAEQCLDCVARGEEQTGARQVSRRRTVAMLKSLASVGAGGGYLAYAVAEHWFQAEFRWASVPLFLAGLVFVRSLRAIAHAPAAGDFGNSEQGLPCWQATTWMQPKRSGF